MSHKKNLKGLFDNGRIDSCDYYFALSLARVFPKASCLTLISAALASQALCRGMICLDIEGLCKNSSQKAIFALAMDFCLPDFKTWCHELETDSGGCIHLVKKDFEVLKSDFGDGVSSPLILDEQGCLYLGKYFYFRVRFVKNIRCRQGVSPLNMDSDSVQDLIENLFEGQDPVACAPQKKAVVKALLNSFTIISGGPGTGKTHITRMIASQLKEQAAKNKFPDPVIFSLAPTGKAASRLENGVTIHSALSPSSNGLEFVHNKDNPLSADLVIIDEGSMIDLALITRLFEAIPISSKVVLLGDANQLPSVEVGAAFSELCQAESMIPFRTVLTHNFRSQGKTGIEKLGMAIQEKDISGVQKILKNSNYKDLVFHDTRGNTIASIQALVDDYIKQEYSSFFGQQDMKSSINAMDNFRILCAHNRGHFGTEDVNSRCEKLLHSFVYFDSMHKFFKQLVMITANSYKKGLFNGETGVFFLEDKNNFRKGPVGFPVPGSKEIKIFRYADLPRHEPAFAVTIHKSQGSEFDTVLILIPDVMSPVINRQLLYTALTRARKKAIIIGNLEVIQEAVIVESEQTCRLDQLL